MKTKVSSAGALGLFSSRHHLCGSGGCFARRSTLSEAGASRATSHAHTAMPAQKAWLLWCQCLLCSSSSATFKREVICFVCNVLYLQNTCSLTAHPISRVSLRTAETGPPAGKAPEPAELRGDVQSECSCDQEVWLGLFAPGRAVSRSQYSFMKGVPH